MKNIFSIMAFFCLQAHANEIQITNQRTLIGWEALPVCAGAYLAAQTAEIEQQLLIEKAKVDPLCKGSGSPILRRVTNLTFNCNQSRLTTYTATISAIFECEHDLAGLIRSR